MNLANGKRVNDGKRESMTFTCLLGSANIRCRRRDVAFLILSFLISHSLLISPTLVPERSFRCCLSTCNVNSEMWHNFPTLPPFLYSSQRIKVFQHFTREPLHG